MLRVITCVEGTTFFDPPMILAPAANTAFIIFNEERGVGAGEIKKRYILNNGTGNLYVSFGISDGSLPASPNRGLPICDAKNNYHIVIPAGSVALALGAEVDLRVDVSDFKGLICGFYPSGTTSCLVSVMTVRRRDLEQQVMNQPAQQA